MKIALLTGGAGKLGAPIANLLTQLNFHVIIHYATQKDKASSLIQSGIAHHSIKADFNDQESFTKMLHDIYALYPKIDLLINNASIFEFDTATNFEPDTLKKHLQINAIAPTMLISNIIRKQAGKLFAINMLDIMTQKHTKGYFSYNLSKRMLETSSYLINNSASNVAIENLYLNKIDTTEDLESLLLKLSIKLKEHFVA